MAATVHLDSAAFGQADTPVSLATWQHEGTIGESNFSARCGGAHYEIAGSQSDWTLRRNGASVSADIDTFLSRALSWFEFAVAPYRIECNEYDDSRARFALTFNVVKVFNDEHSPQVQLGRYNVLIEGDEVSEHVFFDLTMSQRPSAQLIDSLDEFLRERGLNDVPGVRH